MDAEVVVIGGGFGGLTVAALLAARGVDVCLVERESQVGGCISSFDKFGYCFEQGYGLFAHWEDDGILRRLFAELPVQPPDVRPLEPSYVVRLPDGFEVAMTSNAKEFEENLKKVFPECGNQAVAFYRELASLSEAFLRLTGKSPNFLDALRPRRTLGLLRPRKEVTRLVEASRQSTRDLLTGTSFRFQRFIDVQLQSLAQGTSDQVSHLQSALSLNASRGGMFGIRGGAAALANRLADSIKLSGGRIRLNTPALRLAYNSAGDIAGLDLLSGERLAASKAIISNLTIWDTYGKLVGLNRTPPQQRQDLKVKRGWGAYLMFLGWEGGAVHSARTDHVLSLLDWKEGPEFDPEGGQIFFCAAPSWDQRAPEGKRAVTVHSFTDVDDWFTFHSDETELEARDQQMLETCWLRLHQAMPELGNSIEVIDTATPRTFYEQTRRKLGMVGGLPAPLNCLTRAEPSWTTAFPNLFIVSDTVGPAGLSGLAYNAAALAAQLSA